jgi:hypothetical protein
MRARALLLDRESGSSVTASSESLRTQTVPIFWTKTDIFPIFLRLYIHILCSPYQSLVDINLPVMP